MRNFLLRFVCPLLQAVPLPNLKSGFQILQEFSNKKIIWLTLIEVQTTFFFLVIITCAVMPQFNWTHCIVFFNLYLLNNLVVKGLDFKICELLNINSIF